MVLIRRYTVDWTGGVGGPGVSTFYSTNVDGMTAALHAFFTTVAPELAAYLALQVNSDGLVIEDTTGEAVDNFADTPVASISATGTGSIAAPAGSHINWLTSAFVAGKRVRGRTFLVPMASSGYATDGTLDTATRGIIQGAANDLVTATAGTFLVWARPFDGDPTATPPKPARDGSSHSVGGSGVPDKVAMLTSRRQ